jgi:uncharacterized delta-60 repeat protein/gliding motility-associated-like protein
MKTLIYAAGISCLSLLSFSSLKAQEGTLDASFGTGGILKINYGLNDYLKSVVIQPDGKILVAGKGDNGGGSPAPVFYVARLRQDGSFDGTFNGGSPYTYAINPGLMNSAEGVALQNDGNIVFGGYTGSGSGQRATFGKLSSTGSTIVTPVSAALVSGSNANIVTGLSYNRITNTTALSAYDFNTSAYMIALKYLTDGTPDPLLGGGSLCLSTVSPVLLSAKAIANLNDGSFLLAGYSPDFSGNNQYTVVKIKKNGSLDTNFGNATPLDGTAKVAVSGFYGYPNAMTVLPNGKILLAGKINSSTGWGLMRLNADGTVDASFNMVNYNYPSATGTEAYSIAVQPDNKIIVSGKVQQSVNTQGIVMRYNPDGTPDNTWGSGGVLLVNMGNTEIYGSAFDLPNKQIYFVGKTNGSNLMVARVNYYAQPFNIIGKDIVSSSSENIYTIHPFAGTGYSYLWSYSSPNIYDNGLTNDSVSIFFKKDSPSGTLTCVVTGGGLTKTITKSITVNTDPNFSESLEDVSCALSQTRCQNLYIDSLVLSARESFYLSKNSGCSPSGYYDYTSSSKYDTLTLGDNYKLTYGYKASSGNTVYAGVWIDLDNNGKMNNSREYVGASFSANGIMTVNNILIPSDAEEGAKRMRVRLGSKEFTYNDCCPTNDEAGETEDYLVLLQKYDGVSTPNFITPNDDGKNDIFVVKGVEYNVNNTLKVYNRVGDLVYETSNYDNSWTGKDKNGNSLKAGTYYYVFTQKSSTKPKDDIVKGFLEIRY